MPSDPGALEWFPFAIVISGFLFGLWGYRLLPPPHRHRQRS
jgi:hypothetical protein